MLLSWEMHKHYACNGHAVIIERDLATLAAGVSTIAQQK